MNLSDKNKKYYQENRARILKRKEEQRELYPNKFIKRAKDYRLANPKKVREYVNKYIKNNPEKVKKRQDRANRTLKQRFRQGQYGASRRHILFQITFEQWLVLIHPDECFYCGGNLPPSGFGLDRISNDLGYTLDNIKCCCTRCNKLFMEYDKKETYLHMQKVLDLRAVAKE